MILKEVKHFCGPPKVLWALVATSIIHSCQTFVSYMDKVAFVLLKLTCLWGFFLLNSLLDGSKIVNFSVLR